MIKNNFVRRSISYGRMQLRLCLRCLMWFLLRGFQGSFFIKSNPSHPVFLEYANALFGCKEYLRASVRIGPKIGAILKV
jgi:hypothetical protein